MLQITLFLGGLLARSLRQRRGDELSRRRGCSQQSRGERLLSFDRFFKSLKNVLKLMISLSFRLFSNKKPKMLLELLIFRFKTRIRSQLFWNYFLCPSHLAKTTRVKKSYFRQKQFYFQDKNEVLERAKPLILTWK